MILKKLIIILILSSVTTVFADDLIVDKNAMSQYQRDNYYLQFDPFKYDLHFEGGSETREKTPDNIDLSDKAVVLGNSFTQEVWIKPLQKGNRIQEIIGNTGHFSAWRNTNHGICWMVNDRYGFDTA